MAEVQSWELKSADKVLRRLDVWATEVSSENLEDVRYQAAFEAIDEALLSTIRYMRGREEGRNKDGAEEHRLSGLWVKASQAASSIDHALADALLMKGMGWTDPESWLTAEQMGLKIKIADVQEARLKLNGKRQAAVARRAVPNWFPMVGVLFAAVTVAFLMYLLAGPPLPAENRVVFDALMALSVAASATFLGGNAATDGRIPFFKDAPIKFSATGGVAVFVIVFVILRSEGS